MSDGWTEDSGATTTMAETSSSVDGGPTSSTVGTGITGGLTSSTVDTGITGGEGCDIDEFIDTTCPGAVADAPQALFDETVLLRPPRGEREQPFVLQNQSQYLMQPTPFEAEGCVDGCSAPMIDFGAVGYVDDAMMPLATHGAEILDSLSYPAWQVSDEIERGIRYWAVIDVPDHGGQPSRSRLYLHQDVDRVYWIVYRCHPDHWNALKESFLLSIDSLLIVP